MHASVSTTLQVIVVEDDILLRERILLPRLREHGFGVTGCATAAALHDALASARPDIIVLNLALPDADGFALARSLRTHMPAIGLVVLAARRTVAEQIRGLVDGADAFLCKPIQIDLLVATLHSLGRRLTGVPATTEPVSTQGGSWRLDAGGWRLLAPCGAVASLTRCERPLLRCLIERSGEVVRRDALIAQLTGDVHAFDPHRLDSMIHRLRRKVSATSGHPFPLLAVHGQGYVFAP